ncbi:MAG: sigma-70 family RNA polymerase sigma factor [Planctomycetes bacterium]|nr:sigma-70 family RNA polymerase sigma factor [Planctomycetota bacterium]
MASIDRRTTFERIVHAHQRGVWRYLRFIGCSRVEADDLTQETFLAAWKSDFEEINDAATAAYLRTVAKSRFLMMLRAKGRRPSETEFVDVDADWVQLVEHDDGWDERADALEDCLQIVQGKAREVIDLNYRVGLRYAEIGERMGMKPEGVRTLMKRVIAKLRECMQRKLEWPAE